jgi:hypothetical protein
MPRTLPTHVFEPYEANAFADPQDTSTFQLTFDTPEGWYHFRLSETALRLLARRIELALQTPQRGFQTQVLPNLQSKSDKST